MQFTCFIVVLISVVFPSIGAYDHEVPTYNMGNGMRSGRRQMQESCVSTDITCTVDGTNGMACEKLAQNPNCVADVTYTFKYCNLSGDVLTPIAKSVIKINGEASALSNNRPLNDGECITEVKSVTVNTCDPVRAQIKVEGPSTSGAWCYDFSFLQYEPKSNENKDNQCDVSADVSCSTANGKDCDNIVTTLDSCGKTKVTIKYTYCNDNLNSSVDLDQKTSIKYGSVVEKIDSGVLAPKECRTVSKGVTVNTCKWGFNAWLKVEGALRGSSEYCYAYKFSDYMIKKTEAFEPTPSPLPKDTAACALAASISCSLSDGSNCATVAKGSEQSGCDKPVKYLYKICNRGPGSTTLKNIVARYDQRTVDFGEYVGTSLPFDRCVSLEESAVVNTCDSDFWADIKITGPHDLTGSWCYGYKFVETIPGGGGQPNVPSPTTNNKAPKGTPSPDGRRPNVPSPTTNSKAPKGAKTVKGGPGPSTKNENVKGISTPIEKGAPGSTDSVATSSKGSML